MCCFNDTNSAVDGREIPSEATPTLVFRLALSGVRRLLKKVVTAICEWFWMHHYARGLR